MNSLAVAAPVEAPWRGTYFRGNPVQLSAVPRAGFRLTRWEGLPGAGTNTLTLLLNGDVTLQAVFEPAEPTLPRLTILRLPRPDRLEVGVAGAPGSTCRIESSPGLVIWTTVGSVALDASVGAVWTPPVAADGKARFYRATLP